jgi:hypothetical protein
MTHASWHCHESCDERRHRHREWDDVGRAAERFARRVARDASKFAERVQEHAAELADDFSRSWRRARREGGPRPEPDLRRVFDDVRGVLHEVVDGLDELIARTFQGDEPADDERWLRVVSARQAACDACGRPIAAGDEAWVRRTASRREMRCTACGAPEPERGPEKPPA